MKKALLVIAAVATVSSAFAQGTIVFENNNTARPTGGTYKIPIWVDLNRDGARQHVAGVTTDEVGLGQYAALNSIGNGLAYLGLFRDAASTTPLAFGIFRSDNNGDFLTTATSGKTAVVSDSPGGSTPTLVVRAWAGNENYALRDTSLESPAWSFTTQPLGGAGDPPSQPPAMFGWGSVDGTGFGVQIVPEPSTIALGAIGIGALLLRRRK